MRVHRTRHNGGSKAQRGAARRMVQCKAVLKTSLANAMLEVLVRVGKGQAPRAGAGGRGAAAAAGFFTATGDLAVAAFSRFQPVEHAAALQAPAVRLLGDVAHNFVKMEPGGEGLYLSDLRTGSEGACSLRFLPGSVNVEQQALKLTVRAAPR